MKKKRIYTSAIALFCCGALVAQNEMDAFRFSHLDLNGSARSMSMGGAFGALGGDMSAMSHNPAGIGVYRSSEIQATLDLKMSTMSSSWTGVNRDQKKTNFNFDNFSYVGYFPTGHDDGIKGWNIGFSYNKVKNFNRRYKASGSPQYSMADYAASRATNANSRMDNNGSQTIGSIPEKDLQANDAYNKQQWLPVLGYKAGFFGDMYGRGTYHSAFGEWNADRTEWKIFKPDETVLEISERGSIDEYNFSLATNISDRLFLGATFGVTDIDYQMSSWHSEYFGQKDNMLLYNALETEGTGYSFNIGAIVRPVNMLRIGVAYNSPKWYRMTDYYYAEGNSYISDYKEPKMSAKTPENASAEYRLRTPGRWIFSLAGIIGTSALVSVDYELTDYKSMHLSDRNGRAYADNEYIEKDFGYGHTVKIGGEYKVTPQFAVRAGYVWQPSPMNKSLTSSNRKDLIEILPAGTIPHYSVLKSTDHFTVGLGYRFTPNFYMDLACIYRIQNEKLYPFSNTFWDNSVDPVNAEPAKVDAKTTRVALTFGYKF
ncbi:MAG: outer membrane protein transport protein [Tannerella sp.]|jgi:hypothetical protein|nr:outer membrane protein transport protein [Tannerella sp.]